MLNVMGAQRVEAERIGGNENAWIDFKPRQDDPLRRGFEKLLKYSLQNQVIVD